MFLFFVLCSTSVWALARGDCIRNEDVVRCSAVAVTDGTSLNGAGASVIKFTSTRIHDVSRFSLCGLAPVLRRVTFIDNRFLMCDTTLYLASCAIEAEGQCALSTQSVSLPMASTVRVEPTTWQNAVEGTSHLIRGHDTTTFPTYERSLATSSRGDGTTASPTSSMGDLLPTTLPHAFEMESRSVFTESTKHTFIFCNDECICTPSLIHCSGHWVSDSATLYDVDFMKTAVILHFTGTRLVNGDLWRLCLWPSLTTVILRNNMYINCTAFGRLELCSVTVQGQFQNIPTSPVVEGTSAAESTTTRTPYVNTVEPTTHIYTTNHNVNCNTVGKL